MIKEKVIFNTPGAIADFINICSKYDCDINLYDDKNIINAKPLMGVFAVAQGRPIEVQIVSSNEDVIVNFINDIRKFKV